MPLLSAVTGLFYTLWFVLFWFGELCAASAMPRCLCRRCWRAATQTFFRLGLESCCGRPAPRPPAGIYALETGGLSHDCNEKDTLRVVCYGLFGCITASMLIEWAIVATGLQGGRSWGGGLLLGAERRTQGFSQRACQCALPFQHVAMRIE